MAILRCQRLSLLLVSSTSALFFILFLSQTQAHALDPNAGGPPVFNTVEFEAVSSSPRPWVFPTAGVLRSEMPSYANNHFVSDSRMEHEADRQLLHETAAPDNALQPEEGNDIPLLDETVVEGKTPDPIPRSGQESVSPLILSQTSDEPTQ